MNNRIQALRGVSIFLVLLQHGLIFDTFLPTGFYTPGWSGVHLFFVISGCVISESLLRDGCHFGRFMVRRVFRLWPALIAFLMIVYVLNRVLAGEIGYPLGALSDSVVAWYSAATMSGLVFPAMFFEVHTPVPFMFAHIWSLSVEDIFYLAFGSTAVLFLRRRGWGVICGLIILLLFISVGRVITSVFSAYQGDFAKPWRTLNSFETFWMLTKTCMAFLSAAGVDFLIAGIIVCLFARTQGQRASLTEKMRYRGWTDGIILLGSLSTLSWSGHPAIESTYPNFTMIGYPFILMAFSFVVYRSWRSNQQGMGVTAKMLKRLGDVSYSLYLIHIPVAVGVSCLLYRIDISWQQSNPKTFAIVFFSVYAPVSYALAVAANRWIEKPFIRRGKYIMTARTAQSCPRHALSNK